jgi:glycosyltransferase involved in cell wall biosynthesis
MTCRRAIAVSNYARQALSFGLGEHLERKVAVVYHGVNRVFGPSERQRSGNYLLAVSDIYVQKNLHTLMRALAAVRIHHPEIVLKIAGKAIDADYLREIRNDIAELKLGDAVEFLGECSTNRLLELYCDCKLFVFPSTVETFGNPLVEAMACGAPIVSSDTAAMPEILGNAAVFFDPLDAHDMAERIIEVLSSDQSRERLTVNALARAKLFSWDETARRTAGVIKSVVPLRYSQIVRDGAAS